MAKVIKEKINFLKVREVKSPSRAYEFDAGIDFYVPKFTPTFLKDLEEKNPQVFRKLDPIIYTSGITLDSASTSATITLNGNSNAQVEYDLNDEGDEIVKFDRETGKNYFLLAPHQRVMIPSGIKSRMAEPGRALIAANKSGVATKQGLIFGAQVVDYTYKGEIHLSVINSGTKVIRIYEDMKILQFLETPVFTSEVEVTESLYEYTGTAKPGEPFSPKESEFYKGLKDDRGAGGFGSTDKK